MKAHNLLLQLLLLVYGCTALVAAQERTALRAASGTSSFHALTGKERLGPKWTDEQRTDNCKVPIDKRGTKPRPSSCQHAPEN